MIRFGLATRVLLFGVTGFFMQQPRLPAAPANAQIESKNVRVEFNSSMHHSEGNNQLFRLRKSRRQGGSIR